MEETKKEKKASTMPTSEQKVWGAVGYLWILSLVVLAARKNNDYIRFHANQGVFLFLISVVVMILGPIGMMVNIVILIASIMGIIKSLQGTKWELPGVAGLAKSLGDWIVKTLKL